MFNIYEGVSKRNCNNAMKGGASPQDAFFPIQALKTTCYKFNAMIE